jgi:hypothetical protein
MMNKATRKKTMIGATYLKRFTFLSCKLRRPNIGLLEKKIEKKGSIF